MVQINFARKEINCKIVYYGPGLSGKTTSLEVVHARTPEGHKGELTSISTDGDRTLFFDFMPLDLGTIAGMKTKFHLYTVPGQVYYNSTRKLVLLGADGIIFVADSTPGRMDDNLQSMENLRENLAEMGRDLNKIPLVIQYNKRDLPSALSVEELEGQLNPNSSPHFEASAKTGEGVFQTLKAISALVLEDINSNEKKVIGGGGVRRPPAGGGGGDTKKPASGPAPKVGEAGAAPTGLLPDRDVKQVLRPAAVSKEEAQAVARGGSTAVAARPTKKAKAQEPVEPMEEAAPARARATGRSTVKQSRAALARQIRSTGNAARSRGRAASGQQVPKSSGGGMSTGKMVVLMTLGILAGAAAAVAAVKLLLQNPGS